jgi:integrase
MHRRQTAFWAWGEKEWTSICEDCKGTRKANALQHVMAIAAILCGIDLPLLRNQERRILRRYALAVKIFGREATDSSINLVLQELKRLGYAGYFHPEVRNALCELFLLHHHSDVRRLDANALEHLRTLDCAYTLKQATYMISHALVGLGVMKAPLHPYIRKPKESLFARAGSVGKEWFSWCKKWHETSTLRPSTRRSHFYRLLVAGRWLRAERPSITRPEQWTRHLAAEYVATICHLRAGQFIDDPRASYLDRPLSPSGKMAHIHALRCFFGDLMCWELIPSRFDPRRTFGTPRELKGLLSPRPRIIAEDVWAKLLWAGLNLQLLDLPGKARRNDDGAGPRFPLELFRALSMVWLFAGLRRDEISRLKVGCIRWQKGMGGRGASSVCLLEVPPNKTNGGYTKPVHRAVGDAIEQWQKSRPAMWLVPDDKTGEMIQQLFSYRGRNLGKDILNGTIIPTLCRKAGVPERDARGPITSHRARSTIATQLYNAKQPMSLLALKEWLGHRRLESTQWYATVTPAKLTEAYLDTRYFERNVAVIQVLLDRAAIETGAAAKGAAYKYVHLGHGYCANPYWSQCAHRMACQRCDFYVPGESTKALILEANAHNQRLLEQIPVTETERQALEGDQKALTKLVQLSCEKPINTAEDWQSIDDKRLNKPPN